MRPLASSPASCIRALTRTSFSIALFLLCIAAATASQAQTLTTLVSFQDTKTPLGAAPLGPLVQGFDGDFYGITPNGGLCHWSCGTVFKITTSGTLTTLYSFCVANTKCPSEPLSGLTLATDGTFYGTTFYYPNGTCGSLCGAIFQITPGGTLTVLDIFDGTDGSTPQNSPLLQALNGNFYGTAGQGGTSGVGTVFETTPGGTLTALYDFCSQPNCTDGNEPTGGLIQTPGGIFYGTTVAGGTNGLCVNSACGTVFSITSAGKLTTLYNFCAQTSCYDGATPLSGVIQANDGKFYGTTSGGGTNNNGTVFKITAAGALTTLYRFCTQTGCTDGAGPSGLVQANDGNFYGVTALGGTAGSSCFDECGTIFKITPQGILTTLYEFCAQAKCTDGYGPHALVQATDGNFYGVTEFGGGPCGSIPPGCGTVFKFSAGLAPFVKTLPTSGKVGSAVTILGTNLTGATAVMFHGVAAAFTVVSSSEIAATVPAGATTGKVKVTTPGGTLTSNVVFHVQP
jgi:uncharacterized repeat protein (TIGR03803 family)